METLDEHAERIMKLLEDELIYGQGAHPLLVDGHLHILHDLIVYFKFKST